MTARRDKDGKITEDAGFDIIHYKDGLPVGVSIGDPIQNLGISKKMLAAIGKCKGIDGQDINVDLEQIQQGYDKAKAGGPDSRQCTSS
ncbi:MAG UNVERIFIED_CONTAM: hypothetical protein LVQ98_08695 [Rickettsiaceae bacterium]|jgi:hypothetical protein